MFRNALIIASGLCVSSAAYAEQVDGPRVEARLGWNHVQLNGDFKRDGDFIRDRGNDNAATYGAEVGYDVRLAESLLLGVYGNIDFASNKRCTGIRDVDRGCLRAGRNLAAGARIGTPIGDQATVYLKGGYSNGRLRIDYDTPSEPERVVRDGRNRGGYHVGGGADFIVGSGVYAKLEYVYTNYRSVAFSSGDFAASADAGRHQVVAGVGFRF